MVGTEGNNMQSKSNQLTSANRNDGANATHGCKLCDGEDTEEMVACDKCDLWFHYECVNVTDEVEKMDWVCEHCQEHNNDIIASDAVTGEMGPKQNTGISSNIVDASKSKVNISTKSNKSNCSSKKRVALQLKRLEEEHQMEKKFIIERYKILEQNLTSSDDDSDPHEQDSNRMVNDWLKETAASKRVSSSRNPTIANVTNANTQHVEQMPTNGRSQKPNMPGTSNTVVNVSSAFTSAPHQTSGALLFPSTRHLHNNPEQHHNMKRLNRPQSDNPSCQMQNEFVPQMTHSYLNMPFSGYSLPTANSQTPAIIQPKISANVLSDVRPTKQQLAARQSMPKELPTFSGRPDEWPLFISSYEQSTQTCGFSQEENLIRLQKALKGKALDSVKSRLLLPSCVPGVLETLRILYGRPEVIIHTLLSQIRSAAAPKADKLESIIDFSLSIQNLSATIEASGLQSYISNPSILEELVEKLPAQMKLNWAMFKMCYANPNISTFNVWLDQIARAASEVTYMSSVMPPLSNNNKTEKRKEKGFLNTHAVSTQESSQQSNQSNISRRSCRICEGRCPIVAECNKFINCSHSERWNLVRKHNLCRKCLRYHGFQRCRSQSTCNIDGCTYKHHKLLHNRSIQDQNKNHTVKSSQLTDNCDTVATQHEHLPNSKTLFRIVPVLLSSKHATISTFAFIDDGSSITLLEEDIANKLHLVGTPEPLCLKWTSDTHRLENDSRKVALSISGTSNPRKIYTMPVAHTVKSLNLPLQSLSANDLQKQFKYLRNIPLQSYSNATPRILIGIDNAKLGLSLHYKEGKLHEPVAAKTRLGWTVYGSMQPISNAASKSNNCFTICTCKQSHDDLLHQAVKNYFSSENTGVQRLERKLESRQERRAREIQEKTTKFIEDRYETGLLWKSDNIRLPESYGMALKRFESLEKKLSKDVKLQAAINNHVQEYVAKGYARKVTDREKQLQSPRKWYLPVFPVKNQNKPEKLRIVWDAAAESKGMSLNAALLTGPDQTASLLAVLWKFRQRQIGICGDIREMFHQVRIREEDIHSQRFLWRTEPDGDINEYVMLVMTFGATCSPSSAQHVKNINALEYIDTHPRAVAAIIENHYVDDYLDSVEGEAEAVELANSVKMIHFRAGFEIRNWISNSQNVTNSMNESCADDMKSFDVKSENEMEKVLGMWWCTSSDCFTFTVSRNKRNAEILSQNRRPTKRELLRVLMTVFDPMGLLANFLIHLKILLQKIWRAGVGWDEELPDELFKKWLWWLNILPKVEEVKVARWYNLSASDKVELHVFVDASEDGTAAVAYFRRCNESNYYVSIIASKSRVAPIRQQSIPKLELEAATLGARLSDSIMKQHTLSITRRFLWTDSKTVIAWLRSENKRFKQFVSFRVGEILELTNICEWRWLPGKLNVADEPTKWGNVPDLKQNSQWFCGPEFLYKEPNEWPENLYDDYSTTEELRPHYHHTAIILKKLVDYERFSQWRTLQKSMAFVFRFLNNFKAKFLKGKCTPRSGPLTQSELQDAHNYLICLAQQDEYADEIATLQRNKTLPMHEQSPINKSSQIYNISPYLDEFGIVRAYGRIDASCDISFNAKRPIPLPRKHYITQLILQSFHQTWHHHNNATQLNEIRQMYSIPRLRSELKFIIKNCQRCKVNHAQPKPPQMAPLPAARLATFTRPFSFIGIDYFGPMIVKVGRRSEKRWGVLITCLTIRAVHIEISHSLSTDSCLMSLRNFIARRGKPIEIYSDCGTNFKGTNRELHEVVSNIDEASLATALTTENTKWIFNPPASPHMGGSWERLVRSVKTTLKAITPTRTPSDELLRNMLIEVESIINSRPLTYVPLEIDEDEALTPNHFLLGSSSGARPIGQFNDEGIVLRRNWMTSQQFANHFWRRWIREYLPTLTRRTKWMEPCKPVDVDDIVIIVDDALPRSTWPKGRIIEVFRSKDGQVRRARVQTAKGIYERPAHKLAVLDVEQHNSKHEIENFRQCEGDMMKNVERARKSDDMRGAGVQPNEGTFNPLMDAQSSNLDDGDTGKAIPHIAVPGRSVKHGKPTSVF